MSARVLERRERERVRLQAIADRLVGRTITAARVAPTVDACVDLDTLVLTFADGGVAQLTGGHTGDYSRYARNEYVGVLTIDFGDDEDESGT